MKKYDEKEIVEKLKNLEGWNYTNKQISKDIKLKDFKSVMSFVNKVADEAEKMNHHPDILIYSWNKVQVTLSTHSEGGVTQNDFDLAEKIDGILLNI